MYSIELFTSACSNVSLIRRIMSQGSETPSSSSSSGEGPAWQAFTPFGVRMNRAWVKVCGREGMLEDFRISNSIPDDVIVELPVAEDDLVHPVGDGVRVPIPIWMIAQGGLRFPIPPMLRELMSRANLTFWDVSCNFVRTVMASIVLAEREGFRLEVAEFLYCYSIVFPSARRPRAYLRLKHIKDRRTRLVYGQPDSDKFKVEFVWVSGNWEFAPGARRDHPIPLHTDIFFHQSECAFLLGSTLHFLVVSIE